MDKKHLYIVLTRTNTIVSRLIRLFMKDEYTHASIALDRDLRNMYSFGRKYIYNPFIGAFRREYRDKGVYKLQKIVPCIVLEVEVTEEQYEKAQSILNQFISNSERYKYNYKGLLYNLFNAETCDDKHFLCSEFVYYVLNQSGIVDFNIPRNLVRPQSLLNIKSNIVFKGDLKCFGQDERDFVEGRSLIRGLSAVYE
jgi:hypothetical protein